MSECPECGFDWDVYVLAADKTDADFAAAHAAIAWITGTNDVASVIAGAIAARAARGGENE